MFHLACTRFNNTTYNENLNYRKKHEEQVIYGSTLKIRDIYTSGSLIFVAEMNNEKNIIEGIGLIKNLLVHDRIHKIYEINEYNSYIYRGKYWLSREQINMFNPEILEIFDTVLFKGKSHLKCRIGITVITEKLFVHWNFDLKILKHMVKQLFLHYFTHNIGDKLTTKEDNKNTEITIKKIKNEEIKEDDIKKDDIKEEKITIEEIKNGEEYIEIIPKKRKRTHKI